MRPLPSRPRPNTATVTINDGRLDADATTVSIAATDATGSEPGADDGLFTVACPAASWPRTAESPSLTRSAERPRRAATIQRHTGTVTIPGGQATATHSRRRAERQHRRGSGDGHRHLDGHQSSGSDGRRGQQHRDGHDRGRRSPPRSRSRPPMPTAANRAPTTDCSP